MAESDQKPAENTSNSCVTWDVTDVAQQEVSRITKEFKLDVMGIIHLGSDGILRSLTADRTVLSAEALTLKQIEAYNSRFPKWIRDQIPTDIVDGTKTPKEKWFEPDEGVLPAPLPQEGIDEVRNSDEKHKDIVRKRMREDDKLTDVLGVFD